MRLRNTSTRYGAVTQSLHWAIVALFAFQVVTGLLGADDDVHGTAGVLVLVLATIRVGWRQTTTLPDWAPELTATDRVIAHWTERALYAVMFLKPITGLLLIGADGDEVELFGMVELPPFWPESDD